MERTANTNRTGAQESSFVDVDRRGAGRRGPSAMAVMLTACLMIYAGNSAAQTPEPYNQIVILIDASGSYRDRQEAAVERTLGLVDGLAATELQRWEDGADEVTIISVDAMPQAIWSGTVQELKTTLEDDSVTWADRFRARREYRHCTDVEAALNLAVQRLDGDPLYVDRYLFIFSDLVHEPPTTSIRRCEEAETPSPPPAGFPIERLENVTVAAFWVPADQVFAWRTTLTELGLEDTFLLYTEAESDSAQISPPPRAELAPEVVEEIGAENRAKLRSIVGGLWKPALVVAGVIVGLVFVAGAMGRRQRNRRPARRPGPPRGRRPAARPAASPSRRRSPVRGRQLRRPQRPTSTRGRAVSHAVRGPNTSGQGR